MNIHDTPCAPHAAPARRQRLDELAAQAQSIILSRQDAGTGLLPASTAITVHGDYTHAWVRDNVYSILAVWALGLAYQDIDTARAAAMHDSVRRLMRGLLSAMMRQSSKVERFKHTQDPLDALHAKYATDTGEPVVGDADWGHLQIDATALYVLMLARMSSPGRPKSSYRSAQHEGSPVNSPGRPKTSYRSAQHEGTPVSASDLAIVQHPDEAAFVQNLVHYLARAHRTPDYGIWERGHKHNGGVAELNASSIGMAKAALQAIAGFDPLPGRCPPVQVVADDIADASKVLEGLLPRESASKETDAALLSVIGFPAFAVDDPALAARTRREIVDKLQGRYGCKRFLRDGHQTVLEDASRLHYEPGELLRFEHIESEWPLFFTYLLLDAALAGDDALAADYRSRLEDLMQTHDGQRLLPELYYVPEEAVEAERAQPHSQARLPNDNVPLVWAQSLYLVAVLLQEGYVDAAALKPPPSAPSGVEVQVALLASDGLVQARLAAQGIHSETLQDIAGVRVGYAQALQGAFGELGRSPALGLSGRPAHRLGSLATSCVYTVGQRRTQTLIVLPSLFDRRSFYLWRDNRLLVAEVQAELTYIRRHWRERGEPLLALWISEPMLQADGCDELIDFLSRLQRSTTPGVHSGPLAELLKRGERRHLDWIEALPEHSILSGTQAPDETAALPWDEAATRPLTSARAAVLDQESDEGLCRQLARSRNPYELVEIVGLLFRRHGAEFDAGAAGRVGPLAASLYARAGRQRRWGVLRRAAGLLDIYDETLEDAVAQIVARRKRIALGRDWSAGSVAHRPLSHGEIVRRLGEHSGHDPRARVMVQEIILLLGTLAKADAALLQGTQTVRPWHLQLLLTGWLAREHGVSHAEAFDHLLELSPHAILSRLLELLRNPQKMSHGLVPMQPATDGIPAPSAAAPACTVDEVPFPPPDGGWSVWREATGAVMRVPDDFHVRVWELLQRCSGLVIGDPRDTGNRLDAEIACADSTPSELGFALQVEDLLNKIQASEYRQLAIEVLLAASALCRSHPQLRVDGDLIVDELVCHAVRIGWQSHEAEEAAGTAVEGPPAAGAWLAVYASPPQRVADLVSTACIELLARAAETQQTRSMAEAMEPRHAAPMPCASDDLLALNQRRSSATIQ